MYNHTFRTIESTFLGVARKLPRRFSCRHEHQLDAYRCLANTASTFILFINTSCAFPHGKTACRSAALLPSSCRHPAALLPPPAALLPTSCCTPKRHALLPLGNASDACINTINVEAVFAKHRWASSGCSWRHEKRRGNVRGTPRNVDSTLCNVRIYNGKTQFWSCPKRPQQGLLLPGKPPKTITNIMVLAFAPSNNSLNVPCV